MKNLLLPGLLMSLMMASSFTYAATDLDELLKQVQESQLESSKINKQREQRFMRNKAKQQDLLNQARAELKPVQNKVAKLRSDFTQNEKDIKELKELLQKRAGDLSQLTALVRQVAGDFRAVADNSMISAQFPHRLEFLDDVAETNELPDIKTLEKLWFTLQQEMTENGKVVQFDAKVMETNGMTSEKKVIRVGPFTPVSQGNFLQYLPLTLQFQYLLRQPDSSIVSNAEALEAAVGTRGAEIYPIAIDPTRGSIFELLQNKPALSDRIQQGGWVGYMIIVLGILGLLLAVIQLFHLERVSGGVKKQLSNLSSPSLDNPLGRVLAVFKPSAIVDVESLELQLDEAILKETPRLERGQALLKLLAAVAPLMGLLGTVVGMIVTFQAITVFGTSDPKLMAGGISQALVTTVLGLVVAIPLLFAHSVVASRSRGLIQILDEQAAGLMARSLESKGKV